MPEIRPNVVINNNFLSPVGFRFQLLKIPVFEFFVQGFRFPPVDMIDNPGQPTPFGRLKLPGSALEFSDFEVTYKVDEYMQNYQELYSWMKGIGRVTSFQPYVDLEAQPLKDGIDPDATLIVLDSSMDPTINFYFHGVYPVQLGSFLMDSTNKEITYITSTVTFRYSFFTYEVLKTPD